jgi:hypothetical protein
VHTAHTADLDAATLRASRALLDLVFEGDLSEHDWEHSLGGVHALVWEGNEVVAACGGPADHLRGAYQPPADGRGA